MAFITSLFLGKGSVLGPGEGLLPRVCLQGVVLEGEEGAERWPSLLIKFTNSAVHVPVPTDSEMSARGLSRELQELAQALSWVIPAQICRGRHAPRLLCKAGAWGSQAPQTAPFLPGVVL